MFVQLQNKLILFSNPRIIEMFLDNVFITNKSAPITREKVLSLSKGQNVSGAKLYTASEIGDNAFANNTMESLYAPNVIKIGNSSFLNCSKLNNPTLSDIIYVGQSGFSGCSQLESFDATHLSDATLHDYAFMDCVNLTSLDGLYGLSVIGNGSLKNCNKLNVRFMNFTNENGTLEFGENALYGVKWLDEEIDFNNLQLNSVINNIAGLFAGNQTIKHARITSKLVGTTSDIFANCSKLETFDSSTLTALNPGTCVNCSNLISVNCQSVTKIPNYKTVGQTETTVLPAFYNTPKLESVNMPNLAECVYFDNTQITEANFPNVEVLEPAKVSSEASVYGFANCAKLQSFSYENFAKLQSIGSKAFANCTSLTSINIGDKVTYIAEDAFQNDAKTLKNINIQDGNSRYTNQISGTTKGASKVETDRVKTGKNFIYDKTTKSIVLGCSTSEINSVYTTNATYKDSWNDYVNKIGPYAFRGCNNLGSTVKWNLDNVNTIGDYAFADNTSFKTNNVLSLATSTQLTTIGKYAFESTVGDQKDFGISPDYIGEGAFKSSGVVKSLTFSAKKKISGIGPSAFMNCTNLTAVTNLGANNANYRVLSIGDYAFYNTGIKSLTYYLGAGAELPDPYNSNVMGKYAFANNKSLADVTIGYGTCLNDHVFDGCTQLTGVTFKIGYESFFGSYVFANCTKLNTFTMQAEDSKKGNIGLGINMFYNCTGLKTLTLPKNANTTIQASAFNKCAALTTLKFNDNSCNGIGALAFNDCVNLKTMTLNNQITSFNQLDISALYGSSLTSITMQGMPDNVFVDTRIDPVIVSATDILSTQMSDFRYGVWYGWKYDSLTAAYTFAYNNNIPVVALCISPRDGNCKYCNEWYKSIWDDYSFQRLVQNTPAIFIISDNDNSADVSYMQKQFSGFGTYPNLATMTTTHSKTVTSNIWGGKNGNATYAAERVNENIPAAVEGYSPKEQYQRSYSAIKPVTIDKHNGWGIQHDCTFIANGAYGTSHTYKWNFMNQTFEQG